jgi:hypothetical protein
MLIRPMTSVDSSRVAFMFAFPPKNPAFTPSVVATAARPASHRVIGEEAGRGRCARYHPRPIVECKYRIGLFRTPDDLSGQRQAYVAIVSGPSPQARLKNINSPELREQRHAAVLYVFGL